MDGDKRYAAFPKMLHAGTLEMNYDSGGLRYIRAGDEEILRRIYVALRDEEWGTRTPFILDEEISSAERSFAVSYRCRYIIDNSPVFRWLVTITGDRRNHLVFAAEGLALAPFKKNRAGLCVLHPVRSCAGQACEIVTPGGRVLKRTFPEEIAPHQPFKNIRKMRWVTPQKHACEITFDGDIFETEDQRNWTDASFKTYSTPLELPFPVLLKEGDTVSQKITISISPRTTYVATAHLKKHRLSLTFDPKKPLTFPGIGCARPLSGKKLNNLTANQFRKLRLDHYRTDIRLYETTWQNDLKQSLIEAELLHTKLKVALHLCDEDPVREFITMASARAGSIAEIMLLGPSKITGQDIIEKYAPLFRATMPAIKLGGGTDCYFAELNRNIIDAGLLDFISFSVNPQVHAFDDRTLVENLEAQYDAVVSTKKLYPHLPVHVSPVTLKPRFNPDSGKGYLSGNMPAGSIADPRQHTAFAAGWTLGSISNLAAAGAEAITYYETAGDKGILPDSPDSSRVPFSPVWLLLQAIMVFKNGRIFAGMSGDTLKCTGIFLLQGRAKRWIIANHTPEVLPIGVNNLKGKATLRELNAGGTDQIDRPDLFLDIRKTTVRPDAILLNPGSLVIIDS